MAASALPKAARAQGAMAPLNFGFQETSWGTIGMIVESEDLFKKAGANVNILKFDSGKTTRDAMIAGRVDVGVIGATPFIIGAAKGQLEAIAVALYGAKTQSVVASAKSGVKSVKDLKGKKVGSQLGSATDFVFQNKILPKFGLSKIGRADHQRHASRTTCRRSSPDRSMPLPASSRSPRWRKSRTSARCWSITASSICSRSSSPPTSRWSTANATPWSLSCAAGSPA